MSIKLGDLDLNSLSIILGISSQKILKLSKIAPILYHEVTISQKNGKTRKIEIPDHKLKKAQKIILHEIFYKLPIHPLIFGGPGSSTKKAALLHTRKHVLIAADIQDFFPSIKSFQIKRMLQYHGATEDISDLLTRLSTHKNHLPQGAPTSPAIGRLVLEPFARELENILKKIPQSSLSIYVDDIILSGPKGVKRFLPTIKKMLTRYGLKINNKTKIMFKDEEQICLNIRVNDGIAPPTAYVQEMQELSKLVPPSDPRLKGKKSYIDYLKRPIIN